VTGKAYVALLEGPFANSILESDSFEIEYYRVRDSTWLDGTGAVDDGERTLILESLEKSWDVGWWKTERSSRGRLPFKLWKSRKRAVNLIKLQLFALIN
jgi:hypothetical protein